MPKFVEEFNDHMSNVTKTNAKSSIKKKSHFVMKVSFIFIFISRKLSNRDY